jgi:phosphohistidine phosphatase
VKTLLLVRHAKSSWGDPALDDHDRPLNERGLRDAPRMGRLLHERGIRPDVVVTSTAARALATAELIAAELGVDAASVVQEPRLYAAPADRIVRVAAALDERADTAMLVAHDPGMSDLANRLDAGIERMPTCAVAQFTFDIEYWSELEDAVPASVRFDAPR